MGKINGWKWAFFALSFGYAITLLHVYSLLQNKNGNDNLGNNNNINNLLNPLQNALGTSKQKGGIKKNKLMESKMRECTGYYGTKYRYPKFPTFVIAGAQKTGTTSLLSYFARHPLIAKPALREPHFFDKKIHKYTKDAKAMYPGELYLRNETWCHIGHEYYKILVDADEEQIFPFSFEKTPSYLHRFSAARTLRKTCPWIPKVIITLRNPVDRAYSHYQMALNQHAFSLKRKASNDTTTRVQVQALPFEHYIKHEVELMRSWGMTTAPPFPDVNDPFPIQIPTWDHAVVNETNWTRETRLIFNAADETDDPFYGLLLRKGIYAPQLNKWYQQYPRGSIMVLDYRELQADTQGVYYRILDFAKIPRDMPFHQFKKQRSTDYEPMSNATREYLEALFAPFNAKVQDVLGGKWKGAWTEDW